MSGTWYQPPPQMNSAMQWGDCTHQSHSDWWWLMEWDFWSSPCESKIWLNLWCLPANFMQGKDEGGLVALLHWRLAYFMINKGNGSPFWYFHFWEKLRFLNKLTSWEQTFPLELAGWFQGGRYLPSFSHPCCFSEWSTPELFINWLAYTHTLVEEDTTIAIFERGWRHSRAGRESHL